MSPTPFYRGGPRKSAWTVTGPEYEHAVPSEGAAIALAVDKASRGEQGAQFAVREHGDVIGFGVRLEHWTEYRTV